MYDYKTSDTSFWDESMTTAMRPVLLGFFGLTLLGAASSCSADQSRKSDAESLASLEPQGIDRELGEYSHPNEQLIAQQISEVIEQSIRRQYSPGSARRDAHPKAHGCVKAEFHVMEGLSARLAKGLFVPGKTYQARIRFSNASGDATRPDFKRDARGMAMQILGVPGIKLLENQPSTQDFILVSHPVFFANDPERYLSLIERQTREGFFGKLLVPFALGAKGTLIALKTVSKRISNPLQTRYWSMVPYQLGTGPERQAVKYSARSCGAATDPIPDKPGHDFLRDALQRTLQQSDACMEFLVQPRTSDRMAVEDSMTEWDESEAPFYPVARIVIPKQVFNTPVEDERCENLSFSPWHALPEHKPLGVTNRMRRTIYDHISRVRREPASR